MSTPLGDFIHARRDATTPESVKLPVGARRRVPGLRRSELAALAGVSVEYLQRIEQGRDRNPSVSVVNALATRYGSTSPSAGTYAIWPSWARPPASRHRQSLSSRSGRQCGRSSISSSRGSRS